MKQFILKLFIFSLPVIISGYYLDKFLSLNLKKSNSYTGGEYGTWNAIIDGKLNAEILVYGSSRAWVHFDPKIMEDSLHQSVYNLGMDGHTFNMQYLRHLMALKNNPKPKMIIHSVDIGTLSKGNLYEPDQFLPYMLWNTTFYDYMSKYDGFSYVDYKIPLTRYYGKYNAITTALEIAAYNKIDSAERIKGYHGQHASWNKDFDNAKKATRKFVAKPDSLTLNLFNRYLKECKDQNIEVILVYSPVYIEGQKFIENQEQIINIYESLARKYGHSFMDFTSDEICFNKNYFYNATHMNITGAELFTRKLCVRIKNRNVQRSFVKNFAVGA